MGSGDDDPAAADGGALTVSATVPLTPLRLAERQPEPREPAPEDAPEAGLLAGLYAMQRLLSVRAAPDAVMGAVKGGLSRLLEATHSSDGSLLVLDEADSELVFSIAVGGPHAEDLIWTRLPQGRSIAHWCLDANEVVVVNNPSLDERFGGELEILDGYRTRSLLALPLAWAGKRLGVVELLNKGGGGLYTHADVQRATLFGHFASMLLLRMALAHARRPG